MTTFVDIFKNPLPMITLSATISLAVYFLSENLNGRTDKKHRWLDAIITKITPYSRRIVFTIASLWAVSIYAYAAYSFQEVDPALSYMARMFGLSALGGLYLVLLLGVLRVYFPKLKINTLLLHASRGFGLATFMLACLHLLCAFIANLDGKLNALQFLSTRHQVALGLSSAAFIILFLLAITSVDRIIAWMSFSRWKKLHRFVHLAVILVLFHAFLIGSHFTVVAAVLPLLIILLSLTFLFLEVGAIYKKLQPLTKNSDNHKRLRLLYAGLIVLACSGMFVANMALQSTYNPHAGHTMTYSDAYTIEVATEPTDFSSGQEIRLKLKVNDKKTGQPWTDYSVVNEKLLHLIVISEDMQRYEHLHPDYLGNGDFEVSFTPPIESTYYLYAEFAPSLNSEALARAEVKTKNAPPLGNVLPISEGPRTAVSGRYSVELKTDQDLQAKTNYPITFTIEETQTNELITNFESYLGMLGHLAIIHENKLSYLHVHPTVVSTGDQPLTFSAQFPEPGMYRMYLQFKHEGQLNAVAFTVRVQ